MFASQLDHEAGAPGTVVAPLGGFEHIREFTRAIPFAPAVECFLFVRHGQTEGNRLGIYQAPETPLNGTGEAQAVAAAAVLADLPPLGRMVASPMARAWRTANVIAQRCGAAQPEPDGGLQERLYLGLVGQPVDALDWAVEAPGCERLSTFVDRAGRALGRILSEPDAAGPLVIVSHGGVLLVLAALLGLEPGPELRRNAVPLWAMRDGAGWQFEPVA